MARTRASRPARRAPAPPSRPPHAAVLAAIGVAVVLAYAGSFGGGFVLDSRVLILENPILRAASPANVRYLLTHDYWQPMASDGLYRPLTTLSFLLNYAVFGNGDRPFGYHAVNLALHLGCAGLVYALVWTLVESVWPAAVAAAVFGLHPVATEAVTNIVGRADLLATLGVLGGLLCHARGGRWRGGLVVAAAVAAFSKESGIVLLAAMLAYDALVRRTLRDGLGYAMVVAVFVVYGAARSWVAQGGPLPEETSPLDNPLVEAPFLAARLTALRVLALQIAQLLWPATLSADYSYAQIPVGTSLDWVASVLLLAGAAAACVAARGPLRFLLALFLLAVLPTANLLVLIGSIRADRFLYLPLAAGAGIVALLADRVAARNRNAATALIVLAVLAAGVRTFVRNRDWTDELGLWSHTVRTAAHSAKAHKAYAAALFAADPRRVDVAIAEAERALAIRPDYLDALVDLGGYYVVKAEAVPPPEAPAWYARAVDVLERGRPLAARNGERFVARMLARGVARDDIPEAGNPLLLNNLSLAYAGAGRFEDALAVYEALRRLQPTRAGHSLDVSAVLCMLERWDEAAVALSEALILEPGHQDAAARLAEVYRRLGKDGSSALDPRDPVVHAHRCRALAALARRLAEAKLPDSAARVRAVGTEECALPDRP
jgi:tetratricopeptide (TPR) repeat protein